MGHIRLGRLPKSKPWAKVFQVLEGDSFDASSVASAVAAAAQREFSTLQRDPGINYCFWVLARVATAARSEDFAGELRRLGIQIGRVTSGLTFVQRMARAVEQELTRRKHRNFFVQMAELTLRDVLSAAVVEQSRSLFGTGLPEIQSACRRFSTEARFGATARQFFAALMSRVIQYTADKELSNYVGSGQVLTSPGAALAFQRDLQRHCFESARIVEDFAGGWLSKHNWQTNDDIPEQAAAGFTMYALEKICQELQAVGK